MKEPWPDPAKLEAIREESEAIQRAMAEMINDMPRERERIARALNKAFQGHPMLLCVASLADALSNAIVGMDARERSAMVMAFIAATLRMADIRDERVH